jgi:hypothetical protein
MPTGLSMSGLVGISPVDLADIFRCSAPNRAGVPCELLSRCWNGGRKGVFFWKRLRKGVRLCVSTSIATLMGI